jgi:chemotaxis protein CheX
MKPRIKMDRSLSEKRKSAMSNANLTEVLNAALEAIQTVIPFPQSHGKPALINAPIYQPEMGVLIGITGDIRGRMILEGTTAVFGSIGSSMFGMVLEGEMLDSFTGELGNMIAGNLSTTLSQKSIAIDITPPTVIVGQTKLYGFSKAVLVPVQIESVGDIQIIFALED